MDKRGGETGLLVLVMDTRAGVMEQLPRGCSSLLSSLTGIPPGHSATPALEHVQTPKAGCALRRQAASEHTQRRGSSCSAGQKGKPLAGSGRGAGLKAPPLCRGQQVHQPAGLGASPWLPCSAAGSDSSCWHRWPAGNRCHPATPWCQRPSSAAPGACPEEPRGGPGF